MKKIILGCLVATSVISTSAIAISIVSDDVVGNKALPIEYANLFSNSLSSENDVVAAAIKFVVPQKDGSACEVVKHIVGNNRKVNCDAHKASATVELKGGQKVTLDCHQSKPDSKKSPQGYKNVICELRSAQLKAELAPGSANPAEAPKSAAGAGHMEARSNSHFG